MPPPKNLANSKYSERARRVARALLDRLSGDTREGVLEEAARVADAAYAKSGWHRYYRNAALFIATEIRALKS